MLSNGLECEGIYGIDSVFSYFGPGHLNAVPSTQYNCLMDQSILLKLFLCYRADWR